MNNDGESYEAGVGSSGDNNADGATRGDLAADDDDDDDAANRPPSRLRFWAPVVLLSAGVVLPLEVLDVLYRDTGPWIRWYGADETIGDGADWCEAIDADLAQFIIEPWNSRSDYAFTTWGCFLVVLGISDARRSRLLRRDEASGPDSSVLPFDAERGGGHNNDAEGAALVAAAGGGSPPPSPTGAAGRRRLSNPILRFPHLTIANGIYNLLHGLGSFWNHACECRRGGRADVAGMLAVVVFAASYTPLQLLADPTTPARRTADALLSALPPLCQTLLFVLVWNGTIPAILTFSILVYVTLAVIPLSLVYLYCWRNKKAYSADQEQRQPQKLQRHHHHRLRWWLYPAGVFCFGMAFWAWTLDLSGTWCFDEGILAVLQGHAVWHVLSAAALGCTYYLYRTEEVTAAVDGNDDDAGFAAAGEDAFPRAEIVESGRPAAGTTPAAESFDGKIA